MPLELVVVVVVMAEAFRRRRLARIALLALFLYFSIPQSTHFKASKVMEHSFNLLNGELAKA